MQYIYAALLLHKLGKPVDEANMRKIMEAAGAEIEEAKIKTLVASLKGVDIGKALEEATVPRAAPIAEKPVEEKEEKKEMAAEGLSALFG